MATVVTQGQRSADGSGINNFNPNTGQRLSAGQSVTVGSGGGSTSSNSNIPTYVTQNGVQGIQVGGTWVNAAYADPRLTSAAKAGTAYSPVAADTLTGSASPLVLPTPKAIPDYSSSLTSALSSIYPGLSELGYTKNADGTFQYNPPKDATSPTDTSAEASRIRSFLGLASLIPKKDNIENDPAIIKENANVEAKRQAVQSATNQLNSIMAKRDADQLAVTGQGRGIPEVIIGGQQAQIAKEAAIQALPVAAALSAAQGDLASAEQHLDRLYKIKTESINNDYEYKVNLFNSFKGFIDKEDEIKLKALETKENRAYQEKQDFLKVQNTLLQSAAAQSAPASVMTRINSATTPQEAITAAGPYAGDILDRRYKQAQIDALGQKNAPGVTLVDANGNVMGLASQRNYAKLSANQQKQAQSLNNLVVALKDYRTTFNNKVGDSGIKYFGEDAALLQTKLNSIIFAAAQAEGTGALQKADRDVIEQIIPNPTSISGAYNALTKGGKQGSLTKIDDQIQKYTGNLGGYGLIPTQSSPYTQSSGAVLISPDGKSQVSISSLTPAQIEEAKAAGWK